MSSRPPAPGHRRLAILWIAAVLTFVSASHSLGQSLCSPEDRDPNPQRQWDPPLNRVVSFQANNVSLRDALDLLGASAGVRISYSPDRLPVMRPVCHDGSKQLGDALLHLTAGSGLVPVAVSPEHVVLSAEASAGATPSYIPEVIPLERVLVSGSPAGVSQRGLAVAVDVLDAEALQSAPSRGSLSGLVNPSVPGLWVWEQSPASLLMRYASIRGASSFGASYPKIYIDGIEVANPLLLRRLIPETIDRVEVIRGPQGAALHGMDAISGVINIVTRQGGTEGGGAEFLFRSEVGLADSEFQPDAALAHEHAAAVRLGDGRRSAGVDLEYGDVGHLIPDASNQFLNGSANFRVVGANSVITTIARFAHESASSIRNPLLRRVAARADSSLAIRRDDQLVQQYTLGLRARFYPEGKWTHTLIAGIDGDRVEGIPDDRIPLPLGSENRWATADGGADRLTLRGSSAGTFSVGAASEVRLTFAAEHSSARERSFETRPLGGTVLSEHGADTVILRRDQSTAGVAIIDLAARDQYFATFGGRVEHRLGTYGISSFVALPVLGGALVFEEGDVTAKLRGAFGRGTRPVSSLMRGTSWPGSHAQIRSGLLLPEEQSGIELGADLSFGSSVTVQITAFDQVASGLVQRVAVASQDATTPVRRLRRMPYALQNLGEISNRGVELETTAMVGSVRVAAAAAYVDSRVEQTATGYSGDLRPGDRMLEVPRWTASLSLTRSWGPVSAHLVSYRAADWINYDRMALARDFAAEGATRESFAGGNLRDYWRQYDGTTRVAATLDYDVSSGLAVVVAADNLTGEQIGEPDNSAAVPGRTLAIGMRARF